MRLSSTGQNPCGPLAGNRDRDRRPCEGFSRTSATRPVAHGANRAPTKSGRGRAFRSADFSLLGLALARTKIRGLKPALLRPVRLTQSLASAATGRPKGYAMIFVSHGRRVGISITWRAAVCSTPMMAADRSTLSCRAIFFLLVLIGLPSVAISGTLEDSAKDLARKIAAALPSTENVSWEMRNISSLRPEEISRIDQALKAELQDRGIRAASGITTTNAPITVLITLSENFKNLVWTAEIHQGETSRTILTTVERTSINRAFSGSMPVTIRSEKFWEGPQRILDAGEISNGSGKSWLVLLLPDGLLIQDEQTGYSSTIEITSMQGVSRDPWGNLKFEEIGNSVAFFLSPRVCTVNLETRAMNDCLPGEGSAGGPSPSRFPVIFDIAPGGPPQPGRGTEIEMRPVCGGANQFLATGGRDYTQTDSLQVFQAQAGGAAAVSTELDFPGPITALHAPSDTPRAVVRNVTTGNYEAYRLSFSCGR